MRSLRSCLTIAALALLFAVAPTASARSVVGPPLDPSTLDPTSSEVVHCVGRVVDVDAGVAQVQESCFDNRLDADRLIELLAADSTTTANSNTIGWHFSDTGYSGSNIRILGTTCDGGVWIPSGFWNNNIESTLHYCGSAPTRHWDYSYCAGTSLSIWGSSSSLGSMNDRTSCVQYGY